MLDLGRVSDKRTRRRTTAVHGYGYAPFWKSGFVIRRLGITLDYCGKN